MSLQVWLPLNRGEIRNQGLANISVINNGATYSSTDGKIGGCYNFNGSSNYLYTTEQGYFGNNYSFSAWIYTTSTSATQTIGCIRTAVGSGFSLFLISGKLRIDPGGNSIQWTTSYTYPANTWFHLVVTYDGTAVKYYINGEYKQSYTTTISSTYWGNTLSFGASQANGSNYANYLNGRLNDVRVYNHALSQMEVKKLSKGLVLHYPLNRGGLGQENNIKTSIVQNRGCNNFIYNDSTNEWTMTCPTGSGTWGFGIVLNDRTIAWKSGESWLVSMEVYTPRAINWKMDINNKPDLADISSYTGNDYDDQRVVNTNGVQNSYQLQIGWNKLWFTQRAPSTYGLTNYSTNWGIITTNETSAIDIKIKNIKGEIIGSGLTLQPTLWCPNSADALATMIGLNDNIEYDTSGFNNHGTRIGTFDWTSDTPKYQVSTHIGATNQKIHISNFPTSGFGNSYSFAWWGKRVSNSPMFWGFSNGIRLNGMYLGTLWNTGDSSNNPIYKPNSTTTISAPSIDIWHHYVMTGDGTICKLYLDGELYGQAKTYKAISGTSIWINGWDSGTQYCSDNTDISDFRIYATALSASDVLELYNNKNF